MVSFQLGFFRRGLRDELVRQKSIRSTRSQRNGKDPPEKESNGQTLNDDHTLNNDQTQINDKTKILDKKNGINRSENEGEAS